MTYVQESFVESRVADIWRQFSLEPGFDIEALLDDLGLGLIWDNVPDENGLRVLGQLKPYEKVVVLNERYLEMLEEKDGRLGRFTLGHEIGHWELHSAVIRTGTLRLFDGERILCRDGSSDPIERQAEMFSAALLMPREVLREALTQLPWRGWRTLYQLADHFVVNITPMKVRLERLDWIHLDEKGKPATGPRPVSGQGTLFSF